MIGRLFNHLVVEIRSLRFLFSSSIHIGRHARICGSAKLKIIGGGNISIGERTEILAGSLLFTYGGSITIGKKCSINPYTIIYGHGNTKIGDNVLIAGQCMIVPNSHIFSDKSKPINTQGGLSKGIVIEDDVWLGHGCSVLDGVTIGSGSVIGAGSVVNKSIPAFSIAAGVPIKIISQR
jgi:acetyltransferase-like isoleucine patch superfamily enzyme